MSVDSTDVIQALAEADEQETREIKQALGIGHTRRDVLKGAAAVGGGAAIGAGAASEMTGEAKAQASTSDSDGNVGLPDDRVDVFAEGIHSNSVETGQEQIKDTATNPSANGEVRRNGSDVKVYSGGEVQNLTRLGADWLNVDLSGDQTVSSGDVKIQFDQVNKDDFGTYDATNYQWTAPTTGLYMWVSQIRVSGLTDQDYVQLEQFKNGAAHGQDVTWASGTEAMARFVYIDHIESTSDTYEMYIGTPGGGTIKSGGLNSKLEIARLDVR